MLHPGERNHFGLKWARKNCLPDEKKAKRRND